MAEISVPKTDAPVRSGRDASVVETGRRLEAARRTLQAAAPADLTMPDLGRWSSWYNR